MLSWLKNCCYNFLHNYIQLSFKGFSEIIGSGRRGYPTPSVLYFLNDIFVSGENVDLMFIRSAALAFDQAIIGEYDDLQNIGSGKKHQTGNTVISKSTEIALVALIYVRLRSHLSAGTAIRSITCIF